VPGLSETLRAALEPRVRALWYGTAGAPLQRLALALLAPFAALTRAVARRRRAAVRRLAPGQRPAVIVVGNVVAGGAGKTPVTIALAEALQARGWAVGLLSAGYRAARQDARLVPPQGDAREHGDEPVLLAQSTGRPVAAGRDRGLALSLLQQAHPEVQVVLSDDGLQHAGLPRSLELALFDARGAGNGRLLPAGPLRQPLDVVSSMDAVLLNGDAAAPVPHPRTFRFRIVAEGFRPLRGAQTLDAASFVRQCRGRRVTALAGVAEPERVFDTLRALGLDFEPLALPDHARFDARWLAGLEADRLVMTGKDAVKCGPFADDRCWALEVRAHLDPALVDWLEERLRGQSTA